jgi:hypothetical protein
MRRIRRRLDDRGGITMVFVLLISGGVTMGMGAIVADVGNIYAERGQLQAGADGAAMAVAENCARTPSTCASLAGTTAATLANSNAKDGAASVPVVCGLGVTPALPACPPEPTNRSACVKPAPNTGVYVEVRTQTRASDNSTLLPPTLAQGMVGNGSYDGTTVRTCARASWGPPQTASGIAFTISTCEWNEATANGTQYSVHPSDGWPAPAEREIIWMKGADAPTCPGQAGWDAPGGFGWLNEAAGPCNAVVSAGGSTAGSTGGSASQACRDALAAAVAARSVQYVPVYDGTTGTGNNTVYHMVGVAAFVITGYYLSGARLDSWLGTSPCSGNDRCVYGYFTSALMTTPGALGSGTDLGVSVVGLTG